MKMKRILKLALAATAIAACMAHGADRPATKLVDTNAPASKAATTMAVDPVPTAVLGFSERGEAVKGYGEKISDLLFARLSADPNLWLVDRQDLEKTLAEHELSASGMVNPEQAVKIGSFTGSKLLITGSVVDIDKDVYIIAKIIGTETSRVLGSSVKGKQKEELAPLVGQLADEIAKAVRQDSGKLVPQELKPEDRIAALRKTMGDRKRPSVTVHITERHVGQATIDPAAETETTMLCRETGFTVLDAADASKADVRLDGEGFSEFGMRRGNLISVKARVEIKAVDRRTGEILAVDHETAVEVDLTEQIAGKKALQTAAARIAERMLPKLTAK
jgi:curli biogenesis system outer membrane secretion channel CsgG